MLPKLPNVTIFEIVKWKRPPVSYYLTLPETNIKKVTVLKSVIMCILVIRDIKFRTAFQQLRYSATTPTKLLLIMNKVNRDHLEL